MLSTLYAKDSDIVSRRVVDEVLLVPVRRTVGEIDCLYALNEVAARIWELIDGLTPLQAVRDAIVAEFDVSKSEAQQDLMLLVDQLTSIGAIREAGG